MQQLDISFRLKPKDLEVLCDTFPRDERQWPNVVAGTHEQKELASILIPLSRKLITKSYNWLKKDNASKAYKLTLQYYEARAIEKWLRAQIPQMDMGYERVKCNYLADTLTQLLA